MRILAADIGGTNTRLLYAVMENDSRTILAEKIYPSIHFESFLSILDVFLLEFKITIIDAVCIAVAGPVKAGKASVTNLPWHITEQEVAEKLSTTRVKLINDFVAVAHGIHELDETAFMILQTGESPEEMVKNHDAVVIGAGTGLGAAHLISTNDGYRVLASESGHAGFAPQNELQIELLSWIQKQYSHVSVELLLSGSGLYRIYRFLRDVKKAAESNNLKQQMKGIDPAQVITEHALAEDDELCIKTLQLFIEIYGSVAGDIVLHYYPVSELYIAGGIAPKISKKILNKSFNDALINKGPMTENLKNLTVKLVMQEKTGLYGALAQASRA